MCFYLKKEKNKAFEQHIETAQGDLVVYKILVPLKRKWWHLNKVFVSFFYGFEYKKGKIYEIDSFGIEAYSTIFYEVDQGFHSYNSYEIALRQSEFSGFHKTKIIKCIVPKGSQFLRNQEQTVSTAIKIIKCVK